MDFQIKNRLTEKGKPSDFDNLSFFRLMQLPATTESLSMQRNVILVLGMHRSGTSALARMLNLLGCDLPQTLMPAAPANPSGHWESSAIMALNDDILHSAGSSWDDWLEVNPQWYNSPVAASFLDRGVAVLNAEYGASPLFVLKDPRNCRLTRFWFDVLAREAIEPLVVLPLRNPLEVMASLEARDGMHRDIGMLLWLRHVLDAEQGSRGRRRLCLTYVGLLNNWAGVADRMQGALGLTWPRFSTLVGMDVDAFLAQDSRHHVRSAQSLLTNPMISQWVRDADRILVKWAESGEDAADYSALDKIRQQLNETGPVFGRLTRAMAGELHHNSELRTLVEARKSEVQQLQEQLATLQASQEQAAQADAERRVALEQDLAELRVHAALVQETRQQEAVAKAALADEKAKLEEALASVHAQAKSQLTALAEQLTQQQQEAAALERRLAEQLAVAGRDRAELESTAAALRAALVEKEVQQAAFTAERAQLQDRIDGSAAALARLTGEHADLDARYRDAQQALEQSRRDLTERQYDLANATSTLRQREEEIFQALADLDAERKRTADVNAQRESAEARVTAVQDKLKVSDQWVFQLAGERKAMEQRAIVAESRLAKAEKSLRVAWAHLAEMETRPVLDGTERDRLLHQVEELNALAQSLRAQEAETAQRWKTAQTELVTLSQMLQQREAELATAQTAEQQHESRILSSLLQEREADADRNARQVEWLQNVNGVVTNYPHWWSLMPKQWRQKKQRQRLLRRGLFDADSYMKRYPDVSSSGMDPLRHYILHGLRENRTF